MRDIQEVIEQKRKQMERVQGEIKALTLVLPLLDEASSKIKIGEAPGVHVTTGNGIDVIYEWENGKQVLRGIQPHGGALIPLPDPRALARIILETVDECEQDSRLAKSVTVLASRGASLEHWAAEDVTGGKVGA